MNKPWLTQYPAGVPAEIDMQRFASLADVLRDSCQRFADLPAYRSMGVAMTFRELDEANVRSLFAMADTIARFETETDVAQDAHIAVAGIDMIEARQ